MIEKVTGASPLSFARLDGTCRQRDRGCKIADGVIVIPGLVPGIHRSAYSGDLREARMMRFAISISVGLLLGMLALPATAQTPTSKRAQVEGDLANLLKQESELKEQSAQIDASDCGEGVRNAARKKELSRDTEPQW